jgi:hypothetical protein
LVIALTKEPAQRCAARRHSVVKIADDRYAAVIARLDVAGDESAGADAGPVRVKRSARLRRRVLLQPVRPHRVDGAGRAQVGRDLLGDLDANHAGFAAFGLHILRRRQLRDGDDQLRRLSLRGNRRREQRHSEEQKSRTQ